MTFRGASALGALALATDDEAERRAALAEGRKLLSKSSMGHNHFNFCEDGMEACLQAGEWDEVEWFTSHLHDYTREEPLPYSDFLISRGQALADFGRGERSEDLAARLRQLRDLASSIHLQFHLPALDAALADLRSESASATTRAPGRV